MYPIPKLCLSSVLPKSFQTSYKTVCSLFRFVKTTPLQKYNYYFPDT